MKRLTLVFVAIVAAACSSMGPASVKAGEVCVRCRRAIADTRIAAQAIDANGKVLAFRAPGCMAQYVVDSGSDLKEIFVTDYSTGKPLRVGRASFVRAEIDPASGEREYLAFGTFADAVAMGRKTARAPIDWTQLVAQTRATAEERSGQ